MVAPLCGAAVPLRVLCQGVCCLSKKRSTCRSNRAEPVSAENAECAPALYDGTAMDTPILIRGKNSARVHRRELRLLGEYTLVAPGRAAATRCLILFHERTPLCITRRVTYSAHTLSFSFYERLCTAYVTCCAVAQTSHGFVSCGSCLVQTRFVRR